ncbi:hypothetical protein Q1695_007816 [Nippostrongylus brasiliensis]|nr:hypothetical protein Q1695_007816 [Nippostrongylus brasiliensis]
MKTACVVAALLFVAADAKMQNITVEGIVLCNTKPMKGVGVELWERDQFSPDDLLMSSTTKSDGSFAVRGGQDEMGTIEPYIVLTHSCNLEPNCRRATRYRVPKELVDSEYNMTLISLNIFTDRDSPKC